MFARVRKLERLYEARIEDLKAEHARMVKLMADEIEYLRTQIVGPRLAHGLKAGAVEHDFMPSARTSPHFMTEEEEELAALRDGGHIEEYEYRQAIEQLKKATGGVPIDVESD